MDNLATKKTITIGPPARCVRHDITLSGHIKTIAITLGTFPKNYNIGLAITDKVDVMANTPSRKTCYYNILSDEVGHPPIGIS